MPGTILNLPWLNHNENRAYPLAAWASKRDVTGTFTLPDDFLVALYLRVGTTPALDPSRFYLAAVTAQPGGYGLELAYDAGGDNPTAATAVVTRAGHTEYRAYPLAGAGDFADCTGQLAVGRLESVDAQPAGRFAFDRAGGQLDPDCVRPSLRGVRGVRLLEGAEASPLYDGILELVAGSNTRLTAFREGRRLRVRIDAISGEGLADPCDCSGVAAAAPITSINGIPGPTVGLAGNACVRVGAAGSTLTLSDACSQPCCGCRETAALEEELQRFRDARFSLENQVGRVADLLAAFEANVLASRLEPGTCP